MDRWIDIRPDRLKDVDGQIDAEAQLALFVGRGKILKKKF